MRLTPSCWSVGVGVGTRERCSVMVVLNYVKCKCTVAGSERHKRRPTSPFAHPLTTSPYLVYSPRVATPVGGVLVEGVCRASVGHP